MTSAENLGGGPGERSGAGWDLEISAGVGPEEVQRFVAGLAVALAERCLAAGLEVVGRRVDGDDGTPRSIALRLRGGSPEVDAAAPVRLAALLGTHELFDDARRGRSGRHRGHRKRWFAAVRLHRALAPATHEVPALDPAEVELRCDRAGGPGGQHVNTTSTAVRARHLPTQITVRVAEGRSQHHNRSLALERLAALVAEGEARDRDRDLARRRGLHYRLVRGEAVARWRWSDTRRRILEEVPR